MPEQTATLSGFFDVDPMLPPPAAAPRSGFPDPPVPPLPVLNPRLIPDTSAPAVAPIQPPVVATDTTRRAKMRLGHLSSPVASTWVAGACLSTFAVVIAPSNPSVGVLVLGATSIATGAYGVVSGRASWARFQSRRKAVPAVVLGTLLVALSGFLPSSVIVAPKFILSPPVATAAQTTALVAGFGAVDKRFPLALSAEQLVSRADSICINDFASQTPEQEVTAIQDGLVFDTAPTQLTPVQARQILDIVRSAYCGEPGDRDSIAKSEVVWSLPGIRPLVIWAHDKIDAMTKSGPKPGATVTPAVPAVPPAR